MLLLIVILMGVTVILMGATVPIASYNKKVSTYYPSDERIIASISAN